MAHRYVDGFEVRVLRGTRVDDPYDNGGSESDPVLDWSNPVEVRRQTNRPVALESGLEVPTDGAPLALERTLTVYLAYGTDVRERDRVELMDGPYAGEYEVDGIPAHWLNPYTGVEAGCVVRLGKRTGG